MAGIWGDINDFRRRRDSAVCCGMMESIVRRSPVYKCRWIISDQAVVRHRGMAGPVQLSVREGMLDPAMAFESVCRWVQHSLGVT